MQPLNTDRSSSDASTSHPTSAPAQVAVDLAQEARQALLASEAKYREVLDQIGDGYYENDLRGTFVFVNEAFANSRERFGTKRKDGARTMKGSGSDAKGVLWSVRDLRVGV